MLQNCDLLTRLASQYINLKIHSGFKAVFVPN